MWKMFVINSFYSMRIKFYYYIVCKISTVLSLMRVTAQITLILIKYARQYCCARDPYLKNCSRM